MVAFAVIFSGVASSVLAGATTSLLLAFILPVSLTGPVSSIPDRLAGWGLAAGARKRGAPVNRAGARLALLASTRLMVDWYDGFAASLTSPSAVPEPLRHEQLADGPLIEAVSHDLRRDDGLAGTTAARMIWTGDHLDAARRLQDTLVGPARAAAAQRAAGPLVRIGDHALSETGTDTT